VDALARLNGMFAFALWDARRRRLFVARDPFGEKPLYWGVFEGRLLFASEPKVLLAHPSVRTRLNLDALRQYLSFDYVPAPLSIYEGIQKLPAAHTLMLEDGRIEVRPYWQLSYRKPERVPTEEEAAARVEELLADSVRLRLVADVPLGVLLSGGVDSSAIAALAVRASPAGDDEDRSAYLEELIVRRELAMNHVHYAGAYDDYAGAVPDWARRTLAERKAKRSPSDLTNEEWKRIAPLMPKPWRRAARGCGARIGLMAPKAGLP